MNSKQKLTNSMIQKIWLITKISVLIVGLITLLLSYNHYKDSFSFQRKLVAQKIISAAPEILNKLGKSFSIHEILKRIIHTKKNNPLSYEEAEALFQADIESTHNSKGFTYQNKRDVLNILNYYETIGSAYLNNIADRKMIEESFGYMLEENYIFFKEFIQIYEEKNDRPKGSAWKPFQDFVTIYSKKTINQKATTIDNRTTEGRGL